jgi:(1->4)-alpha-D-glucan 1-alpha-D-glucosylmutase
MFRLFWIPRGRPASEGAYVASPAEEILRIIALESERNRCVVVAEDLGTVGPDVRDALRRFGMLSMRLLYFERDYPDPSFLAPDRYPELAACAVTTHDLPTLCGYWEGKDIDLKERLGICRDAGQEDAQRRDRERDKALMIAAMQAQGVVPPDFRPDQGSHPQLPLAVYGYLAKTPCTFVIVSLDDVIGTADQQNMPGTIAEYPNWRQKTPLPLEAIMADRRFVELADMFRASGRTARP